MNFLDNIFFALLLAIGIGYFAINVKKLIRNIKLGNAANRNDQPKKRWLHMARIALGQSKMVRKPLSGLLHVIVYVGFVVINIELLEIIIDGFLGTHRVFAPFLGGFYDVLIATFEVFAALVLVSVVLFWIRRNVVRIKRFWSAEMTDWPRSDANIILTWEIILMFFEVESEPMICATVDLGIYLPRKMREHLRFFGVWRKSWAI